jgi:hypothetical protein
LVKESLIVNVTIAPVIRAAPRILSDICAMVSAYQRPLPRARGRGERANKFSTAKGKR